METEKDVVEVRKEVSRGKVFYPNNAIRPAHLNEDANLVDIKSWILKTTSSPATTRMSPREDLLRR